MYNDVNQFLKDFKKGLIKFPTKRDNKTDDDIKDMMANLKEYNFKSRFKTLKYTIANIKVTPGFKGENKLLLNLPSDYEDFNILSDMFMEEERMKCKFAGSKYSPWEYFHSKTKELAEKCLKEYGVIDGPNLIETRWAIKDARECTSFRPSNMIAIIQLFFPSYKTSPISVLDPSAGWGDRLIAAIATGSSYTGVDPNPVVHPRYKDICEFFEVDLGGQVQLFEMPFEEFVRPPDLPKYDLVFTSPPYFKMEIYSQDAKQSTIKHTSESKWTEEFFKPYLEKAWDNVKDDGKGIMCMVINSMSYETYVHEMIKYMEDPKFKAKYMGIIPYAEKHKTSRAQPMFIWSKAKTIKDKTGGKVKSESKVKSTKSSTKKSRISLREFTMADLPRMYDIQNNPDNMKYIASGKTKNLSQVRVQLTNYIREYKNETYARFYAICLNDRCQPGELIGFIGYYIAGFEHKFLKDKRFIRILIDAPYQGKGYGKEILPIFIGEFPKLKILAMVDIDNLISNKLFATYKIIKVVTFRGDKYNIYDLSNG